METIHASFDNLQGYKLFFDYAPDAVVLIDQYNQIRFWNPKAEAIFGWPSSEVIGKSLSSVIVPPSFRQAHDNGMKRYLATGEIRVLNKTIEVPALHQSGKQFFIALTISKVELKDVTGFLAFIRDITEQRDSQAQLEQKTRELERSNRSLEDFAHAASHDLKEPVRKIHLFSERIRATLQERMTDKEMQYFKRLELAAKRMTSLIDDILNYSQLGHSATFEQVDLNSLMTQVLDDLDLEIESKKAQINVSDLGSVKGQHRQLQQVFHNLISNALKYSRTGIFPVISITGSKVAGKEKGLPLLQKQREKEFYMICVRDNGIGFEQSDAERIFHIFTRLHGNMEVRGTGIGLSIVRKVIENHNGYILAESELGKGSTFKVFLPGE